MVADTTAAGGVAVRHPNAGAAKLAQALAQPANYFEQTFTAEADVPYRLWVRGKAQSNYWGNDSVFVQFSTSVDDAGAAPVSHRYGVRIRSESRRLLGVWAVGLGMAGQRVGSGRSRP